MVILSPAHAILNGFGGQPRTACGALDRSEADLPVAEFDARVRFNHVLDSPELAQADVCSACMRALYGRGRAATGREA